jgi:imidazolonepropionase-like amidohydrolase
MNTAVGVKVMAAVVAFFGLQLAQAQTVTRYVLLTSSGSRGGEQVVERSADGLQTKVRFRYKDNGRGPEFTEQMRFARDGTLMAYRAEGVSTYGNPIDERYSRSGGRAEWRSPSEQGNAPVAGPAMYLPLNGSFETVSVSARALARSNALPLLPSGTLRQRVLDRMELVSRGQRRSVQLVAQTGVGLSPALYWVTKDKRPRFFAVIYPGWLTAIEEGWQAQTGKLAARQRAAEGRLLAEFAARARQPLPGLTVVRNARVFDSDSATVGPPSDVYVLRGRIAAVVAAGTDPRRADAEIDAAGRVMLPGLFDMHDHADRWSGALHLAAGVTTVRDMGSNNDVLQQMIDESAAGKLLKPRTVACGFLEGASPFASNLGILIGTLQEAKAAVDWYAVRGYPQLKIYNSFPRELVRETVAHAHARGMRVSGHVPATMRAQEVVEQGFDEVQHINQVLLNFLVTPETDTRTLERFYLPAEKLAGMDFDAPAVRDFIALLKQRNTVIDPTLATFDFIRQRDGEVSAPYASVVANLPPDVQRGFRQGSMKIPDEATAARYRASYEKMIEFVGRLHRAGIPIVAGTDGIAGFTLHSELELYVRAGMTPAEALQVATRNGAIYTRTQGDRGSLRAGKLADLILVDGDPTVSIADLRKVALVMTQGSLFAPAQLHQALGIAPFVANAPRLQRQARPPVVSSASGSGAHAQTAGHQH